MTKSSALIFVLQIAVFIFLLELKMENEFSQKNMGELN